MLLAGIGHTDASQRRNYFSVDPVKTADDQIAESFTSFTRSRRDIAVLLITQEAAERIRGLVNEWDELLPAVLEIPSKDSHYDPDKDLVMQRVDQLLSGQ